MHLPYFLSRVWAHLHWRRFSRLHNRIKFPPFVARLCQFEYAQNIFLGNRVRFLRGAVVLADHSGRIELDDDAVVCRFAIIQSLGGRIRIGKRSGIGDFCSLYGFPGGLEIGEDVHLASGCRIVPSNHGFSDLSIPIAEQPSSAKGIVIADDVWLGTNVVVLDGVKIGRGAIVGAGAVVNKDVPAFAIVAGVPARILRYRQDPPPPAT